MKKLFRTCRGRRGWSVRGLLPAALGLSLSLALAAGNEVLLQTGGGQVLQRVVVPLGVPTNAPSGALRFDFGFGTDERLLPGEFVDSLTVTVRTTNRTHAVTVLTADRFGVTWAPGAGPGGLWDPEEGLRYGPTVRVPTAVTNFDFAVVQAVLVQLPEPFLRRPSQLVLTLFDNDDGEGSRAVLGGISVRAGNPNLIAVETSASVTGPYGREEGVRVDPLLQTISVARPGALRFYRLEGETPSRVTRLQRTESALVFDYEKEIGQPTLRVVGSNNPEGPFTPVANATFDLGARQALVPLLNAPGFLRVTGSHPVRVVGDVVSGEQRILEYQVFPIPPRLESSAEVAGPYAGETGVVAEPFGRRLRLPGGGVARFYRVTADVPLVIRETVLNGNEVILRYDAP